MFSNQQSLPPTPSGVRRFFSILFRDPRVQWVTQRGNLFIVFGLLFLLIRPYLFTYVPVWDGWGYANCILRKSLFSFSIQDARCYGHPTMAYVWYMRIFTASGGGLFSVYVGNLVLLVAAGLALRKAVQALCPDASETECAACVALFVFSPVLLVHVFHVTPDLAVACFLALCLSALLREKYKAAAIYGFALVFTKEVGAGAYVVLLLALPFLLAPRLVRLRIDKNTKRLLLQIAPLVVPVLAIALYLLFFSAQKQSPVWVDVQTSSLLKQLLSTAFEFTDSFRQYMFNIFGLNFQWFFSGIIAIAAARVFVRSAGAIGSSSKNAMRVSTVSFLFFLLFGITCVVTRMRPFNNARYVLACLPVLILLFYSALRTMWPKTLHREIMLTCLAVAVLFSNILTIDPVSRMFYGYIPGGRGSILSLRISPTGYGRDEMAYNLQFLDITDSLRLIMSRTKPEKNDIFFAANGLNFQLPWFDPTAENLSVLPVKDSFPLRMSDDPTRVDMRTVGRAYFLSFPNFQDEGIRKALLKMGTLVEISDPQLSARGVHLFVFTPYRKA